MWPSHWVMEENIDVSEEEEEEQRMKLDAKWQAPHLKSMGVCKGVGGMGGGQLAGRGTITTLLLWLLTGLGDTGCTLDAACTSCNQVCTPGAVGGGS